MPNSVDDSAASGIDGYIGTEIIEDPTGVQRGYAIVLAETIWAAEKAADAVSVDWDLGPNANVSTADILGYAKKATADGEGFAWVIDGDTDAGMSNAATVVEAEYETSLGYHGMMEPMNCVAMEQDGVWHLFTACQWSTRCTAMTAEALGVEPANVVHHQQYAGTGFGRRLEPDAMIPAALAAKAAGRPVKLVFTREQDVMFDFHQSLTYQTVKGGVNVAGDLDTMVHTVCSAWATKRQAPGFLAESVDKKGKIDPFSTNGSGPLVQRSEPVRTFH